MRPKTTIRLKEAPLRARKKTQTRQRIADAAASLFAAKGYDAVTVAEIAVLADVAEQTVYNFFPSKELLVLDEDAAFEARLVRMITERPTGTSITRAVRAGARAFLDDLRSRPKDPRRRGGLPCLMNTSPVIRRAWLAACERYAGAVAKALAEESSGAVSSLACRLLGLSIVTIFSSIIEEIGRATLRGADSKALKGLHIQIDDALDRLERPLNSLKPR